MKEQTTGGVYPHIRESFFGDFANPDITKADGVINSLMLDSICHIMPVRYDSAQNQFTSDFPWRVRIEKQCEPKGEPPRGVKVGPHYVLDVSSHPAVEEGHSLPLSNNKRTVVATYCDTHSTMGSGPRFSSCRGIMEQTRGRFTVTIWADCGYSMEQSAIKVMKAYVESLKKAYPGHFFLISEGILHA